MVGQSEHLPPIVMGSMALGSARFDSERQVATLRAALHAGIGAIDTAPLYELGTCERNVGRAIAMEQRPVQVFSKVGLRWEEARGDVLFTRRDPRGRKVVIRRDSRPVAVKADVDESLRRLGVDHLDRVHVHMRDWQVPIADTMGTLKDLVREGKIGAVGVGTDFSPADLLEAKASLGELPLSSILVHHSPLRPCPSELLRTARSIGAHVLVHSSLERGLMTGKVLLLPPQQGAGEDFRLTQPQFHPVNFSRVQRLLESVVRPIAIRHDVTLAQLVIAWALADPIVDSVVVGASRPEQARANAVARKISLSREEWERIKLAFEQLELDPNAGLTLARRAGLLRRRMGGILRRHVGRLRRGITRTQWPTKSARDASGRVAYRIAAARSARLP